MPTPAKRKTPFATTPAKRPAVASTSAARPRPGANGNILSFFKKLDGPAPPPNNRDGNGDLRKFGFTKGPNGRPRALGGDIFFIDDEDEMRESLATNGEYLGKRATSEALPEEDMTDLFGPASTQEQKEILETEDPIQELAPEDASAQPMQGCTPPPPALEEAPAGNEGMCPFNFDDPIEESSIPAVPQDTSAGPFIIEEGNVVAISPPQLVEPPALSPNYGLDDDDFIEDEGMENFDDEQEGRWKDADEDAPEGDNEDLGEEFMNRQYMEQQELDEAAFLASLGPLDEGGEERKCLITCPICDVDMTGYPDDVVSRHVNSCLDGEGIPLPPHEPKSPSGRKETTPEKTSLHPPRPPQSNPFKNVSAIANAPSAFSKIMAQNAEDRAWKAAADEETRSRGKRAFQRTCPFYKILPNLNCAVDAFRYGAVEGTNAYFLSHFHSDHYIGLTSTWNHGPIYCSRITANLCRRQLRVDPQYVKELEFEKPTEIPGTGGATVTMLDANHCPGSSLFLFEKMISYPRGRKMQRILHCGDFRASAKHLRHPLLSVAKKNKIDICYLDTTYLNPKYAFPPQRQVIQACMELCISLDREVGEGRDMHFGEGRKAGGGIEKFTVAQASASDSTFSKEGEEPDSQATPPYKTKGKLLVVVGTYSIGKERICMGIAEALNSKIYAPKNKQRICAALEDPELNARLTSDPHAAQVHMTPLMEIRPETLKEYLATLRHRFTKIVGFRPSGWNYKPPNGRFVESPAVQTVLHSHAWRSDYSVAQMAPQRGSTADVKCFGVPYSEHSSFRELTAFCCALDIGRIIPTVK
ncbi:hypothetical protein ABW21_db0208544 [Orbilia brochopaga]|nr:hypothetical protein ABW21_db0208544 [Drechslerella brochopaga]